MKTQFLDRRIPWIAVYQFEDAILDRRIPWIAVYHEDSQFEDSNLRSQFAVSVWRLADCRFEDLSFAVCSFKFQSFSLSQIAVQVSSSKISAFTVCSFSLKISTFEASSLKTRFWRSQFQLWSFRFLTSKVYLRFHSFPFVSLVSSDYVRSLELLDKQLRFRHCQPAFIPDERGP